MIRNGNLELEKLKKEWKMAENLAQKKIRELTEKFQKGERK